MVKRYDIHIERGSYSSDCYMLEDSQGDYVSYNDYKALAELAKDTMYHNDVCNSCYKFRWEDHSADCEYRRLGVI